MPLQGGDFQLKPLFGRKFCWNLPKRHGILFASTKGVSDDLNHKIQIQLLNHKIFQSHHGWVKIAEVSMEELGSPSLDLNWAILFAGLFAGYFAGLSHASFSPA